MKRFLTIVSTLGYLFFGSMASAVEKIEKMPEQDVYDILVSNYTDGKYDNDTLLVNESEQSLEAIADSVLLVEHRVDYVITPPNIWDSPGITISSSGSLGGTGSGIVLDVDDPDKAYILTNYHVVDSSKERVLRFHYGRTYDFYSDSEVMIEENVILDPEGLNLKAKVVKFDKDIDVALLEVDNVDGLKKYPYRIGTSADLEMGDWVGVIGYPMGLGRTLTEGHFNRHQDSSFPCIVEGFDKDLEGYDFYNVEVLPGNSGGPVIACRDGKYEFVGLATINFSLSVPGSANGLPYSYSWAVPVDRIMEDFMPVEILEKMNRD